MQNNLSHEMPTVQKTWVRSLGQEDPLEKETTTHPVFLPGESQGQRSLVGLAPEMPGFCIDALLTHSVSSLLI